MQVEANSERRVKILGIDRSENSPVLTYMETEDDPNFRNSKLAAAPHTVHMMDSGFLAINRQCLVKGKAILAREPKSSNEHMIDDLPKHAHDQHTLSILRDFIDQLKLHNVYEINFYDPLDSSGKLAVIPMLIALWKCMLASETDICDQEVLKSIMNSVIAKFELQIPCKNAVIDATLSGSREEVHIIAEDGSLENSNGTTEHFNKKHDLVFVKTDLHPEDFTPQMFPSQAKAKLLRDAFNNEEDEDTFPDILVPAYMTAHSKNRVRQEDYTCLEVEFDSQVALEKLMNEHEQVEGFEVQQGGILVALKKDSFFDDELIEKIAIAIATESRQSVSSVSFDLLKLGPGASLVTLANSRRFEPECRVVLQIEVKPVSPGETSSEGISDEHHYEEYDEDDIMEEEEAPSARQDDTYDEDEE